MLPVHESFKKEINGKLIEVIPYKGLPCEVQEFCIDETPVENFDMEDFGESFDCEDVGFGYDFEASDYGCYNRVFERYDKTKEGYPKELIEKAKEKYGFTDLEYDEVCLLLEEALHIGPCGWCN
jgi:hypothetical protein